MIKVLLVDDHDLVRLGIKKLHSYRYRLFDKLGIDSDVELTHLAIRHKLIDVEERN